MVDIEHQWYQTDTNVCISLLRKGVIPESLRVDITDHTVRVYISDQLFKSFQLANAIVPEKSSYKVMSMKIELTLAKVVATPWSCLEGTDPASVLKHIDASVEQPSQLVHQKKPTTDWHAVEKEADEIEEGDPLNNLFQGIFKDATDETRRAMIKSFTESGGTVLSTNWDEVGKSKVEVKPPDGMEYKKYET